MLFLGKILENTTLNDMLKLCMHDKKLLTNPVDTPEMSVPKKSPNQLDKKGSLIQKYISTHYISKFLPSLQN